MSEDKNLIVTTDTDLSVDRISKFLDLLDIKNNQKFVSRQALVQPFKIDEAGLNRVNDVANERVRDFDAFTSISFEGTARFSSCREDKKDDFKDFITSSTDIDEPESAAMTYSVFSITDEGKPKAAIIDLTFITERQLDTQEVGLHELNRAHVALSVSGSNAEWVRTTFDRILPILENKKLGGIYRPFWLFRSKFYNAVFAQALGFMGLFIGMNLYIRFAQVNDRESTIKLIEKIQKESNLEKKVDMLTSEILDPTLEPWWLIIFMMGSGAICFGVLWAVTGWLFPKLCPPSIIAFGSSAEKSERRLLLYKYIVFTLLGGIFVIPLLQKLIF